MTAHIYDFPRPLSHTLPVLPLTDERGERFLPAAREVVTQARSVSDLRTAMENLPIGVAHVAAILSPDRLDAVPELPAAWKFCAVRMTTGRIYLVGAPPDEIKPKYPEARQYITPKCVWEAAAD